MSWTARIAFALVPAAALGLLLWLLASAGLPLAVRLDWVPALGIEFAFVIDGLAVLMLLMITVVGMAVFVYAGGYLAGHAHQARLFVLLTLFMLAMIGAVTADDLYVLFLFWEATSVLSFMLVGFDHARPESREAAQQALLITGSGGLALLAGFIALAEVMGTSSISQIVQRLPEAAPTPLLTAALILILVGAFTKSAQFPFHFWLPNAMSAPTPVSAYLHSATMVKLGVYLLARLDPGFGEWPLWEWALKGAGSVTAVWGMLLALRERDLKRILAWSTVATLGTLVVLVGMRGEGASVAVGAMLLAHALYKAPLFFVAGNIDHGTGTRIIDRLGNLRHAMPWTAAAALLAGMSMAGTPLSFGYVAKDVILDAKAAGDVFAFAKVANTFFGAIAVAVAGVAAVRVFWRHPGENVTCEAHEGGFSLVAPPLFLAAVGLVLGLFPIFAQDLIAQATMAMTPGPEAVRLALTPEFGAVFGSLALTLGIGVTVYFAWDPLHSHFERVASSMGRVGMASHYERALKQLPKWAAFVTRALQHGRLPGYTMLFVGSTALALAVLFLVIDTPAWPRWQAPGLAHIGACGLVMAGAVLATLQRNRLALLLCTGLVGYGSAILYLFLGAPDVALTQFAAETVFVIVAASALLTLRRLNHAGDVAEPLWRPGALAVALAFGAVASATLLVVTAGPLDNSLAEFFGRVSVAQAQGRNVVNVILVDFRGLDTLAEIGVVLLSFLAAIPLFQALRATRPASGRRS